MWHTTYTHLNWHTQWRTDYDNIIISYYVSSHLITLLVIHLSYNHTIHYTWWYTYITWSYFWLYTIRALLFLHRIHTSVCTPFEHSSSYSECIPYKICVYHSSTPLPAPNVYHTKYTYIIRALFFWPRMYTKQK